MNKTFLIGRLTKDPQCGVTQSNKYWARFTLAVNRIGKDADFINIVAWEKIAENCQKYLTKGKQVAVVGRIQTGTSERDGVKRQTFDVVAENVEFLANGENSAQKQNGDRSIDSLQEVDEDDDMPF